MPDDLNKCGKGAVMRTRKYLILVALLFLLVASLVFAGCGSGATTTEETSPTTPQSASTATQPSTPAPAPAPAPTPVSQSSFETVGMFDNSPAMVAITYYVANPTKADITTQCNEMKARFIDSGITTNLRISFFDDRANTPDYSGGVDIPESSQPYEIANYYYNASNSQTRLLFLKPIP